jgi:hypothetical protein
METPGESSLLLPLPTDLAAAHAMIMEERKAWLAAQAAASSTEAMVQHLKLMIEKLRRELYGSRSERTARLLDQMELQLEELEAKATEDEIAVESLARQASLPAPPSRPQTLPGTSAARAGDCASAEVLFLLRLAEACEAR